MGRMKEAFIQIMNDNDGIPEYMTIEDYLTMKELNIYNWEEYERAKERTRLQLNQQKDLGETAKTSEGESIRREKNN
jgi:hypothetical protein